ncbi:sorting nexin-16 [Nematostella vectensis]|nr:sorting nexin-16 [Nematostella vectensis]
MASVDVGQVVFLNLSLSESTGQRTLTGRRQHRLKMNEQLAEESDNGIRAPITGYEVVERREKFTVYKIQVLCQGRSWFVFRRYTDFVRLNNKLRQAFSGFIIKMPGKRFLRDNYDPEFLEERAHGLQMFMNSIMRHSKISRSKLLREFLCIDDPPGPFDSLEESRAYCQSLEYDIEDLKEKIEELESELSATKSQLAQARVQQEALVSSLNAERSHGRQTPHVETNGTEVPGKLTKEKFSPWGEKVEVSAHSSGVKPASRFGPLTSTPRKQSHDSSDTSHATNSKIDGLKTTPNGVIPDSKEETFNTSIASKSEWSETGSFDDFSASDIEQNRKESNVSERMAKEVIKEEDNSEVNKDDIKNKISAEEKG